MSFSAGLKDGGTIFVLKLLLSQEAVVIGRLLSIVQFTRRLLTVRLEFVGRHCYGLLAVMKRWFLVAEARILSALCSCRAASWSWECDSFLSDMRVQGPVCRVVYI